MKLCVYLTDNIRLNTEYFLPFGLKARHILNTIEYLYLESRTCLKLDYSKNLPLGIKACTHMYKCNAAPLQAYQKQAFCFDVNCAV